VKIKVLGAAAGGGFPQWNCNARLSRGAWDGVAGFRPRTQSSIAASVDGKAWALFNASPDLRQQIIATPELHPRRDGPPRNSPIEAVVLTNADVDHIAGLINLRESEPFSLYAHERVLSVLAVNSIFNVLNPDHVKRGALPNGREIALYGPDGPLGVRVEGFPVPGKVALFLEGETKGGFASEAGDTIGVRISLEDGAQARSCYYIPGCARVDDRLLERVEGAGCLLFDGTLFTDDEMVAAGVGAKTGARMGHMSISGPEGSIQAFRNARIHRKIFIHINNTNPILEEGSPAERQVRDAGWDIAYDGMELAL
jgi:pyrroloquinoline quinone biosynthesis protein B